MSHYNNNTYERRAEINMMTLYDWCIKNDREDLLEEWNYNKNGGLMPRCIGSKSNKKYGGYYRTAILKQVNTLISNGRLPFVIGHEGIIVLTYQVKAQNC